MLLQKSAREALGLSLRDHIVIIDEAHNLMDTIANIHSASLSLKQLTQSSENMKIYLAKFRHRLKGKNRVYLVQLMHLMTSLTIYLKSREGHKESVVNIGDLLSGKGVDQIRLNDLLLYLRESKLARKLDGYTEKRRRVEGIQGNTPTLTVVEKFLSVLTNPSKEGRIFHVTAEDDDDVWLKYMLLDPTHQFEEIVHEARAVILAGGTMSPVSPVGFPPVYTADCSGR